MTVCAFAPAIENTILRLKDRATLLFLASAYARPSPQKSSQILDVHLPLFAEVCQQSYLLVMGGTAWEGSHNDDI